MRGPEPPLVLVALVHVLSWTLLGCCLLVFVAWLACLQVLLLPHAGRACSCCDLTGLGLRVMAGGPGCSFLRVVVVFVVCLRAGMPPDTDTKTERIDGLQRSEMGSGWERGKKRDPAAQQKAEERAAVAAGDDE